jgi:hypothetical protein
MTDEDYPVPDEPVPCPACDSCGVGGCCPHYCPTCRHLHDEAEEIEDSMGVGEGAL